MKETTTIPGELVPAAVIPTDQLIVVRQLPVIEERLRTVKSSIEQRAEAACALICTPETLQEVKKTRTEMRKEFEALEEKRKQVKSVVLAPYDQFLSTYEDCISNAYIRADAELKRKIDSVTSGLKSNCEDGLREYFEELCIAHQVDFLRYSQAGINVDMASATAKTPTKLRNKLEQFVIGVACDLRMIEKMDDAEEIMVEYKRNLSVAQSVAAVQERHRQVEEEKNAAEQRKAEQAQEAEAVERVRSFAPPVAQDPTKMARVTFTVTDTIDRLRLLKQFLNANDYKYE